MEALDDLDIPIDVILEGEFAPAASASSGGVVLLEDEVQIEVPPAPASDGDPRIAVLEELLERVQSRRRSSVG